MKTKQLSPKISIITPSYNQGQFLEETILSVLNQGYPNLEYIIFDGGSTDESIKILKKYDPYLTYWASEKDKGQTHAINKGFKKATGDLVNWLNSDDMLVKGALKTLAQVFEKHPGADLFFGDYLAVDHASSLLYKRKSAPYNPLALFWGRQLSSQPAVFFKRNLLDRFGFLNENQQFCMDTEFWIRMAGCGALFHQIKKPIGITRVHGGAKTTLLQDVLKNEHKKIVRRYNGLARFSRESRTEDIYYSFMNRFWRLNTAIRRMLVRKDFTFLSASNALKTIS